MIINNFTYKLKSVVIHSGTSQAGHYYSFVRIQNKWHKFDDSNVSESDFRDV